MDMPTMARILAAPKPQIPGKSTADAAPRQK